MKFPYVKGKRHAVTALVLVVLLFSVAGVAFAASSGGEHGSAEPKGWVATDTYRVFNFAVLAIGLFLLVRKPASEALNGRISGIKDELDDLEKKKAEAEKTLSQYNEKISLLEKEAEKIVAQYTDQGEKAKGRILEEAEKAAAKLEAQAKRNIEHEFKNAKAKLQEEVMTKALEEAEKIIRENISPDDQDRLVDEYLDKVVA